MNATQNHHAAEARKAKLMRWTECLMNPRILDACRAWQPRVALCWTVGGSSKDGKIEVSPHMFRIVVRFHPWLVRGLQAILDKVVHRHAFALRSLLKAPVAVGFAASKADRHLEHAFRDLGGI